MDQKHKIQLAIILSLIVALVLRFFYHIRWAGPDFWGDAYHHWLISRLTLANRWIYTDYKGLETTWLPGYHYLIAAVMSVWGRFDLLPAHVTNMILGTLACGLVTWLVSDMTANWSIGLGAGLTLALLPWHIAYSYINMAEVTAGIVLLLILLSVQRDWAGWLLGLLALLGALVRYELTLFLVIIGIWLSCQRNWRAVGWLGLGLGLGLGGWSLWSWYRTGDIWGWLVRLRNDTAWDARFWDEAGVRLTDIGTLARTANQAYPVLAVVGLAMIAMAIGIIFYRWRYRLAEIGWLLVILVGLHWLILGLSFVMGHLPVADPRYLLVTVPVLAAIGVMAIAAIPHPLIRLSLTALYALILLISLSDQMPSFAERAYIITPERVAGEYLAETALAENKGNFWVDAPVTIYYSNLDPKRFFSSDSLLPKEIRHQDNILKATLAAIEKNDIHYVLWEDVPYTFVGQVWPHMAAGLAFEQNGYRFEPVFRYSGWELSYGAPPTIVWQIKKASNN